MHAYLKIANKGAGTYLLEQETTKRANKFIYHPKHPTGIIEIDNITKFQNKVICVLWFYARMHWFMKSYT